MDRISIDTGAFVCAVLRHQSNMFSLGHFSDRGCCCYTRPGRRRRLDTRPASLLSVILN
jgi:hypothetical protein